MRKSRLTLATAAFSFLEFAAACGSPSPPSGTSTSALASCMEVDASVCVNPPPSYANDVVPILDRACNLTCHVPGGGPWPLTNYALVSAWSDVIATTLEECTMPPPDAGPLAASDRTVLLQWLACGAPNN